MKCCPNLYAGCAFSIYISAIMPGCRQFKVRGLSNECMWSTREFFPLLYSEPKNMYQKLAMLMGCQVCQKYLQMLYSLIYKYDTDLSICLIYAYLGRIYKCWYQSWICKYGPDLYLIYISKSDADILIWGSTTIFVCKELVTFSAIGTSRCMLQK